MNDLVLKLRQLLASTQSDALLVNSTNEFLLEYNQLSTNARYILTGFSGSTGDALVTKDKIYLFVDGRYHEQADNEVDKNVVSVVKLQLGQSYLKSLVGAVGENAKLLIVASKNPYSFVNSLEEELKKYSSKVEYLGYDPVFEFADLPPAADMCPEIVSVPIEITKYSSDEKYALVSDKMIENDIYVVTSLEDVAYFTNKRSFCLPFSATYPAKLVIQKDKAILFTDFKIGFMGESFRTRKLADFDFYVASHKNKNIYIDKKSISMQDYLLIDHSNEIHDSNLSTVKTVKNDAEIQHFKYAFSQTDKALNVISEMINSEKIYSELDYYEALQKSFFDNKATALSFKPIIASGSNSSIVHYSDPSKNKLVQDGDFLLVDCGAYFDGGYATDITRTFVKGNPSFEQKKVYTMVLKAFLNAYKNSYNIDSTYFEIDEIARDIINKNKDEGFNFSHSTGHGVGISVHESPPYIGPSDFSKTPILKKTVFTIEPGCYKENCGGVRLENTVYVEDKTDRIKLNSFSKFKFEKKLVEYTMLNDDEKKWLEEWQEQSE